MISYLKINNLALLEAVELDLSQGFVVVTGETGAGKSVLLGALKLLCGHKADRSLVRHGSESCEVQAILHLEGRTDLQDFLSGLGVEWDPSEALLLRRVIFPEKPGRQSINGVQVTLRQLRDLADFWIDFHGPGEPQKLGDQQFQLSMIDAFGKYPEALESYRQSYDHWQLWR